MKTLLGADINSDHCLLAAKIKLKLKVPKQSKVPNQYDLNTLKDSTVRAKYNIDIKNKFQMLKIEETEQQTEKTKRIENKWNNIKENLTNAATNLSKPQKQAKKEWMTEEILELMKQRKEQKIKSEAQYQKLEKEIRNKCREAKERWYNKQCEETEELEKGYKMNKMHAKIKDLTNKKHNVKTGSGCIKDKDGNLLCERDEIARRWTQ